MVDEGATGGLVDGFTHRTSAMIRGIREFALAARLTTAEHFDAGIADRLRTAGPNGIFNYTFFKATTRRSRRS